MSNSLRHVVSPDRMIKMVVTSHMDYSPASSSLKENYKLR